MPKIRLSARSIKLLGPPTGKQPLCYWDETLPGFGVIVYPRGRKSYLVRFSDNGKQKNKIIAPCEVLDFAAAKESARNFLAAMIVLPLQSSVLALSRQPHQAQEQQNCDITFAEFAVHYMQRHAKLHKESWKLDQTRLNKYILPAFGAMKLTELSRAKVAAIHQDIGMKYPYQANRVREQLSSMIEVAKTWEFLPDNYANPARGIKDFDELHRKRWLKKTEVEKLIAALQEEPCIYIRALFVLYLLTGARKRELMSLTWKNVNSEHGFIRIVKTKNKHIHELPLSSAAQALLGQLPRMPGNDFVFPGKRQGQPYVNIDKPWKRIRLSADLLDVRIHDLRRTVGAWLAQDGNSLFLIGKVLNHQSEDATRIYAHLADDSVKTALEKPGARIMPLLDSLLEH